MMTECNFITAVRFGCAVERAAAHVCAQGARIFLLADVKDHGFDFGLFRDVFHLQFFTQLGNRREVHFFIAHFQGNGFDFKFLGIEAPQSCECGQQGEGILAAGHADSNDVAFFNHMVLIHRTADIREHFLHDFPPKRACFAP